MACNQRSQDAALSNFCIKEGVGLERHAPRGNQRGQDAAIKVPIFEGLGLKRDAPRRFRMTRLSQSRQLAFHLLHISIANITT